MRKQHCQHCLSVLKRALLFACWILLHAFCSLWIFFSNNLFFFKKYLSGIPSVCQTVWVQIRPMYFSGLVLVQSVCKSYQQMTKVATSGERVKQEFTLLRTKWVLFRIDPFSEEALSTDHSKAVPLLQFVVFRARWSHAWRIFCHCSSCLLSLVSFGVFWSFGVLRCLQKTVLWLCHFLSTGIGNFRINPDFRVENFQFKQWNLTRQSFVSICFVNICLK